MTGFDLKNFRRAAEVVDAKRSGYLLTHSPADDLVFRLWGRWCDHENVPDVYARIRGKTAHVRLDMAPSGKPLSEQALQQGIMLLFGEETLEIHRRLLRHRRDHGLSTSQIDGYFRRVGNGHPVVIIGSKRVPADRAESVAEQLARLARWSIGSATDVVH
ncbi:MAG: hypothetical protein V3T72_05150 [Thermoanaerobaculia bacterium]